MCYWRRLGMVLLAVAILVLLPVGSAIAAERSGQNMGGEKWAVIVAVTYEEPESPLHGSEATLPHTVADARLVQSTLGVAPDHLLLLTSEATRPDRKPTRANILRSLREIAARAGTNDSVWFYFSGHGESFDGGSYLVPPRFTYEDKSTFLSVTEVRDLLKNPQICKARLKVLVLDACHSGSSKRLPSLSEGQKNFARSFEFGNGLITFASCQLNQSSWDFPGLGGVFTYYLMRGVNGAAAKMGEKFVTLGELRDYVVREVEQECRHKGAWAESPQIPMFLYPDAMNTIPISVLDAETLKRLEAQYAAHADDKLHKQQPLKPGLLAWCYDRQSGREDTEAQSLLRKYLLLNGFPVVSDEGTMAFRQALADPTDTPTALRQAERYKSRFLLECQMTTTLQPSSAAGTVSVRVRVTVEVKSVGQTTRISESTSKAAIALTPEEAKARATDSAMKAVVAQLQEQIQQELQAADSAGN